jgi:tetratricopeptide (TPR) repeat protein
MKRAHLSLFVVVSLVACGDRAIRHADTAPPEPRQEGVWTLSGLARGAVLLPDLGGHRRAASNQPLAQAFFDQGLTLTFGFNHDEAARSYARAAELDPLCTMCYWGVALTLGPNYNMPMLPERARAAWDALTRAQLLAVEATPVEAALVSALARRYPGPNYVEPDKMKPYTIAYAGMMREVARTFPDDLDVQVLFAESLMNIDPWKLWTPEGQPAPQTKEIVGILESVLARAPDHPGANHYYIHAVEASADPGRAIAAADRLGSLVPGAGHLVHMPAHIYQRVGRYADAAESNRRAIAADLKYLATVTPPGYYPFYVSHNFGFLAYATSMLGRGAESLAAAREAAEHMPHDIVCGMPGMDFFWSEPLMVMVRFGWWEQVLAEPKPAERHMTLVALWHHARGMARAARGELPEAMAEAAEIRTILEKIPEKQLAGLNSGRMVLELAAQVVEARTAEVAHAPDAIARWEQAVALEDRLAYNEPADWFYPVRHYLGAALLDAGRGRDAEQVFRDDLRKNPNNGWALFGLWQALVVQQRTEEATAAQLQFNSAWRHADLEMMRPAL